jgi:hypothetical protein
MNLYAKVPTYRLFLGEDPGQLSALLRGLLLP